MKSIKTSSSTLVGWNARLKSTESGTNSMTTEVVIMVTSTTKQLSILEASVGNQISQAAGNLVMSASEIR